MPRIIFETAAGDVLVAEAPVGTSAMRAAMALAVPGIDGDCGGVCTCATCHVRVSPEWSDRVGAPGEVETEMLEFADEPSEASRLSCQIIMTDLLDGVRLKVVRD